MRNHTVRILAFAIFLVAPAFSVAQQKLDIVQIMGQFIQANHAANKCLKPDQQTLTKFNSNFKIVSTRASEEMLKRKPGATTQQVAETIKKASEAVEAQIDQVIRTNGCGDPRIQDLLKRFEIQTNLKF